MQHTIEQITDWIEEDWQDEYVSPFEVANHFKNRDDLLCQETLYVIGAMIRQGLLIEDESLGLTTPRREEARRDNDEAAEHEQLQRDRDVAEHQRQVNNSKVS